MDKKQYRVNQTIILNIQKDVFDSRIPDATYVEKMVEDSIMQNLDTSIKSIKTINICIKDMTR